MNRYVVEYKAGDEEFTESHSLYYIGDKPAPTYEEFEAEIRAHVLSVMDAESPKNLEAIKISHKKLHRPEFNIDQMDRDADKVEKLNALGVEAEMPVGDLFRESVGDFGSIPRLAIQLAIKKLDPNRWSLESRNDCIGIRYDEGYFYNDKSIKENMQLDCAWERI